MTKGGRAPSRPVIDLQLNQAKSPWPRLLDLALAAEEGGYGAVWVFDHLAGSSLGGRSMLEAFTLLGALAASTATVELGTMVANVANRQPAVLAVAASSVVAIGERRFHLGLGAGASPASRWSTEMRAVGQPIEPTMAARHGAVVRTLDTLDTVWSPHREEALATFPLPRPRPHVLVGVSSAALAELAGRRADGVNVAWDHPRRDELIERTVTASADRTGFAVTTWTRWAEAILDPDHPERRSMAALGIDRLILVEDGSIDPARLAARRPA